MTRYLTKTTAASALALMLALVPANAQEQRDPKAKPGGEIIMTYKDDVSTLDPAIGYDWQNWSMIKSLFDGLMDYEPGPRSGPNSLKATRFRRTAPRSPSSCAKA